MSGRSRGAYRAFFLAAGAVALYACSGTVTGADGGDDDVDGGDAGEITPPDDGGLDAGWRDAGPGRDAGLDAGRDGGFPDAGFPDAGFPDSGFPDSGFKDAGPSADAGQCLLTAPTSCVSVSTYRGCIVGDAGATIWSDLACPAGSSCLATSCVTSCVDQCDLGATEVTDAGTLTCALFDVAAQTTVDAGNSLVDRARLYNAYLREHGLPVGQVTYINFTDATLSTLEGYADQDDAAIFTGTYLAAEAWRYKATGSPDALTNVEALVRTLHLLFNVSTSPGYLARFAAPQGSPPMIAALFSTAANPSFTNGEFDGGAYDWVGEVSRDQYAGAVLGYSVAYDVLTDEATRDLIRQDMVTLVEQLMITRKVYPTINGVQSPVAIDAQYLVFNDKVDGGFAVTTNPAGATLTGMQEFEPVVLGLYPDAAVAIQLSAIFEVALQVTANQPAWATPYATINSFFQANVDSWLNTASLWTYSASCGTGYFGNNLDFEAMYDLARLETDPTRLATIQGILENNLWLNGLINDKQSWFAYLFAADLPQSANAPAAVTMGNTQLAGFTPAPRADIPVTNNLPANPSCPGEAEQALDVAIRPIQDFTWQRGPWQESSPGEPRIVYPGVDYLCAYWLAREAGFLQDDSPTQCTRWVP